MIHPPRHIPPGNGLVPGMLLHGGSKDVIPVSFQNPHSVYAYWCMSPNVKQIQRQEFFIKVFFVFGLPVVDVFA